MVQTARTTTVYLKDGNRDGYFDLSHVDDEIYDSNGQKLTVSQAIELDQKFAEKFKIQNRDLDSQSVALGFVDHTGLGISQVVTQQRGVPKRVFAGVAGLLVGGLWLWETLKEDEEVELDLSDDRFSTYIIRAEVPETGDEQAEAADEIDEDGQVESEPVEDEPPLDLSHPRIAHALETLDYLARSFPASAERLQAIRDAIVDSQDAEEALRLVIQLRREYGNEQDDARLYGWNLEQTMADLRSYLAEYVRAVLEDVLHHCFPLKEQREAWRRIFHQVQQQGGTISPEVLNDVKYLSNLLMQTEIDGLAKKYRISIIGYFLSHAAGMVQHHELLEEAMYRDRRGHATDSRVLEMYRDALEMLTPDQHEYSGRLLYAMKLLEAREYEEARPILIQLEADLFESHQDARDSIREAREHLDRLISP